MGADVSPYAVFSEIGLPEGFGGDLKSRHGSTVSPEMYARPDGTVYACGEAGTLALFPSPAPWWNAHPLIATTSSPTSAPFPPLSGKAKSSPDKPAIYLP